MTISGSELRSSIPIQTSYLLVPSSYAFSCREKSLQGLEFMLQSINLETERDALINCHEHGT